MSPTLTAKTSAGIAVALLLGATVAQAQFNLMHEFAGGGGDGSRPQGSLTLSGSMVHGTTYYGGDSGYGTVFRMNTDGSGFSLLHEFGGADGRDPLGSLTFSGTTLYGMTTGGGNSGLGTVFQMNTDGSGFSLLHQFAGGGSDGRDPYGSLTLSGTTLYGMTMRGGDSNLGTVFQVNTDGSGFSLLHEFAGGGSDGSYPYSSLTLSGTTLYGITRYGGDSDYGTAFKMNTDGTGFSLLHEFAGGGSDGRQPWDSLTLSGTTLYGMTASGGDSALGTVFQINTDGSDFQLLHEFAGGGSDGSNPYGSLTLSGTTFYGMTARGGDSNLGTVFQMNTDGSGFSLLREFAGGGSDGSRPTGSLTLSGTTFYGMTAFGGDSDYGVVFKYELPAVPEPSSLALAAAGSLVLLARRRDRDE